MAYDLYLEDRINHYLESKGIPFVAKKMMGGLCYMVDDKMCVGIMKDQLMVRIGEEAFTINQHRLGCQKMDFTGRVLKGYALISPDGFDDEANFSDWINLCLDYHPRAKSSKKRNK